MQLQQFLIRTQRPVIAAIAFAVLCLSAIQATAQEPEKEKAMEIYGFVMMDGGHNFKQIDPNWFDVVRPTKLPAYENQFGTDGNTYFSVRQTRFGTKNWFKTCLGELKTIFEWEMFGTGVDAGQTTLRLRHAYGELGHWGFGQYWSPFMDIDVFPNTVEYWGPSGMVFFRNIQARYMPIMKDNMKLTFALERPGASADQGIYTDRIGLKGVNPRFAYPDFSGEFRYGGKWGYVELAGIVRSIAWQDQNADTFDLTDDVVGWGGNFSTNIKFGKAATFRGSVVYGEGIENYMNDAPVDVGIQNNFGNPRKPILGVALPVFGAVAFLDINWGQRWSSSIGWSMVDIENSNGQSLDAFHQSQYAIANIMWTPYQNVMGCIEGQYGRRTNYGDGWSSDIWKIQMSFKFNFSHTFYRN
jgi:hypothetical protein